MTEPKTEMDTIFVPATSTTSTNGVVVTASQQQDSSPTSTSNVVVVDGSQSAVVQQQQAQSQVLTETPQGTVIQLTNGTNGPGPGLQKVVLEDIRLEDYYNETMEESLCKQFKFQITHNELKMMIENSVLETNTAKPYRYLTGNFIRVFERHVEVFEKQKIPIQKRNNVVYEESLRNNTVYMRVNGDCKLCPKANRVRYVFIIKQKPDPDDKYVEVEAKIRGTHQHDPSMIGNASMDSTTGTPSTSHKSSTARKHTSRLSLSVLNANMSSTPGGTDSTVDTSTGGHHSHKRPRISHKTEATTIQLADPQQLANGSFLSTSPRQSQTNPLAAAANNSSFVTTTAALNLLDKNVINQIANQISSKIMIKLDQINLKVNQISDRLYDLERKLDSVEVAEIQF